MKTLRFFLLDKRFFCLLLGLLMFRTLSSRGQVTWGQITNGLVDYYPLNTILPGNVTPDLINRRDLAMVNMTSNNIVGGNHPGIEPAGLVMNLTQSPGPTVMYYQSFGQNPLDGSGDFLPFINQRGATMNFWIKGPVPATTDLRVFAEGTDNGDNNPLFSLSDQPSVSKAGLGLYLRLNFPTTDPNGVTNNQFADGTYQLPAYYYEWSQSSLYTTNILFDNNWHMFTMEIETNGDVHVFVDGNYDPGNPGADLIGQTNLDNEGNRAITPPLAVTNFYYTTNLYPLVNPPASNPPPNGFVRWMVPGLNQAGAFTAFGGVDRNGGIIAGVPCELSDIAFWNRTLTTSEIQWVMNNGLSGYGTNAATWTGTVSFVTTRNVTYADYSWLLLGPLCEDLVNTGPLIRTNNTFWYDFDLTMAIGGPCPQIIVHETTPVDLGTLAPGIYTLITTSWGEPVMTNTFTIAPVLQANGFDTNGYFQIQMFSGVTNVNYVLQYSTDLVNWTSLSTNTVSTNTVGAALTDYYPVLPGIRFYRVLCQ